MVTSTRGTRRKASGAFVLAVTHDGLRIGEVEAGDGGKFVAAEVDGLEVGEMADLKNGCHE